MERRFYGLVTVTTGTVPYPAAILGSFTASETVSGGISGQRLWAILSRIIRTSPGWPIHCRLKVARSLKVLKRQDETPQWLFGPRIERSRWTTMPT